MNMEPLLYEILVSRHLTADDRKQIGAAFLTGSLTDDEYALIDRMLYGVRHGLLITETEF